MSVDPQTKGDPIAARRFRRTLVSVMLVQVVTLCVLGLLQWRYSA